jgi:hypothetical protein
VASLFRAMADRPFRLDWLALINANCGLFGSWRRVFGRSDFYFIFKLTPQYQNMLGYMFLARLRRVNVRKMLQDGLYMQPPLISFVFGNLAR